MKNTLQKCPCNHCSNSIEFDTSQSGQTVPCPHCGMDTMLFVHPEPKVQPIPEKVERAIEGKILTGGNNIALLFYVGCLFCVVASVMGETWLLFGVALALGIQGYAVRLFFSGLAHGLTFLRLIAEK